MEKENWNLSSFGLEIQINDLNSTQQEVPNYYFNPNWGHSMDHNEDPFESTLSSIVSSPAASNAAGIPISGTGESVVLRELIGRLGTICNSSNNSCNTSCYNTPLNSPPKLNLSTRDHNYQFPFYPNLGPFPSDPGFAEKATRFSSRGQFGLNEIEFPPNGQRSRMESNNDGISGSEKKFGRENGDFGDSREESSVSEQNPDGEIGIEGQKDANSRKRKAIPRGKAKEITSSSKDSKVAGESTDVSSKRSKADEKEKDGAKEKAEENGSGKSGGEGNQREIRKESAKPPEPPKDYIHVRARRGQATDSHSLAERVRREKIGERMKFLQDLVPGCNKVTGKAVMLDEIINYVQSLQRQVEFLSMKLATVNPRMDFNTEALMSKDIFQSHGSLQHSLYSLATPGTVLPYGYQSQQLPPLNSGISNGTELPFSMNHLNAASQIATYSEDDLQSVFQMGFGQNQPPSFPGTTATTQMKVEL